METAGIDIVEALNRALEFAEIGNKRDTAVCLNSLNTHGLPPHVGQLVRSAEASILAVAKPGGGERAADLARQDIARVRQAIRASGERTN